MLKEILWWFCKIFHLKNCFFKSGFQCTDQRGHLNTHIIFHSKLLTSHKYSTQWGSLRLQITIGTSYVAKKLTFLFLVVRGTFQQWGFLLLPKMGDQSWLAPPISYTSDKHNGKLAGVTDFFTSFFLLFKVTYIEQQSSASKCTKSKWSPCYRTPLWWSLKNIFSRFLSSFWFSTCQCMSWRAYQRSFLKEVAHWLYLNVKKFKH